MTQCDIPSTHVAKEDTLYPESSLPIGPNKKVFERPCLVEGQAGPDVDLVANGLLGPKNLSAGSKLIVVWSITW